ncbi:MAG TPA: YceI family protein [Syntrophales bacterium]|nr:YceI family protein [Syntrophales bacterium]
MAKWIIDPDHTVAHFITRHMMIADVHSQFNKISGVVYFDPAYMSGTSVEIEIDAASIWTGVEPRDNHLRSADFFYVEKYPKIFFKSTGVEVSGINSMKIYGELTIRDITKPILLHAEYLGPVHYEDEEGSYTSIGFSANTYLNREDFGMYWNNNFGSGNFMVGKHIDITLNAEADLES